MNSMSYTTFLFFIITFFSSFTSARNIEVDISACDMIYNVLNSMKNGISKADAANKLDSILNTKPYQTMFKHYNRDWRPNHLPESVFKRMILSLQFPEEYTTGENQRADQMLHNWKSIYNDLADYKKNLDQLKKENINKLIHEAILYSQTWLPAGWNIPDSYFFIHPNGGSNGFVINGSQGYDFLQLPKDTSGNINWKELTQIISHESHHLGMRYSLPNKMSSSDSIAFEFLALFVGEGTATKFVDNAPGGCVPFVDQNRGHNFTGKLYTLWEKYSSDEPAIVNRFVNTFEKIYTGEKTKSELHSEIRDYWLSGLKGPAYFLGSEFFGAIYHAFGKEKVFEAMIDPRKMLLYYNNAVKTKSVLLNKCLIIPESAIKHALMLGEK